MSDFPPEYSTEQEGERIYLLYRGARIKSSSEKHPGINVDTIEHAAEECWSHYYKDRTNTYNEGVSTLREICWGYILSDGSFRHPQCLRKRYNLRRMNAVTIGTFGGDITAFCCKHCDEFTLELEEQEEFFGPEDSYDDDISIAVNLYTTNNPSYGSDRIEGYRNGLNGYATQRNMTLDAYMAWSSVSNTTDFQAGYEDALSEQEDEAPYDDRDVPNDIDFYRYE